MIESGYGIVRVYDDQDRMAAEASNVIGADRVAYHSFESDDMISGWTLPTLNNGNCGFFEGIVGRYHKDDDCEIACELSNDAVEQCIAGTNLEPGFRDNYSFDLTDGNITKSLMSGTYKLTLWIQAGTVSIRDE